jgi:serine/threonine protein phosphatase 1
MSAIEKFSQNQGGCDFVVGDIHGCYDLLMAELNAVAFDRELDRLFSVGDRVDRGPDSLRCLNLVFEPWFHAVRGNHELMMLAGLNDEPGMSDLWLMNGGSCVYDDNRALLPGLAEAALARMPYAIEVEVGHQRIGIVHVEVTNNNWALFEAGLFNEQTTIWGRSKFSQHNPARIRGIDAVISGHSIVREPVVLGNQHYIDTGAFHSGRLTVIELARIAA